MSKKRSKSEALIRVKYRIVTVHLSVQTVNPFKFRSQNVSKTERKRFTVRVWHLKKHPSCGDFVIWDKARDSRGGFLYRENLALPRRTFRSRTAAWRHLKTHTEESKEYRLEMLNRALDRDEESAA